MTDGNLLGVVCPGAWSEVSSVTQDRSSCSSAVMLVATLQGYFMVGCMEEGGIEDVEGTEAMGASSLSFTLERFTCRSDSSLAGSLMASVFQTVGSEKVNCMGSNSPFRPLWHTT